MTRGMKLLLDCNSDPEFRNYAQNVIKEYFNDLKPEYIGEIAASMLALPDRSTSYTNRIDKIIAEEAKRRAMEVLPVYLTNYRASDVEKLREAVNKLLYDVVREYVINHIEAYDIDKAIELVVKELVQKAFRKKITETVEKTVDEMMG